ncbi:MAG: hypothetical protein QOG04_1884 [Actinomycetota bacterium]|jgi:hypothetical protein|nr:hypothetical protein [Actinomycetota bacterium]
MARHRRFFGMLSIGAFVVLLVAPMAQGRSHRGPVRMDRAEDCDEYAPASIKVWTGSGTDIALDVLVVLDGVAKSDAQVIVTKAAESYAPLNIHLVATFKRAAFETDPAAKTVATTAHAEDLIASAKASSAGTRPVGSDVVYILTNKDISMGDGTDVVGYSDCIGGVRYPNRAFAVGESIDEPLTTGGLNFYVNGPAKTMAHEIGHLLGARHEDANCVEGAGAEDVSGREPTICTLMTNYVDFQSKNFGTLEAGIIRAHAETYAAP